jgi:hypothetical protein
MRHDEILGLLPRLNYNAEHNFGLWLILLELLFWIAVAALTIALVRFRPAMITSAEDRIARISQHTRLWLIVFGLAVVVIRVGLLPWVPVPVPVVHDEFSYLLGADTFAHGRVTNPPSPMWQHFESFHINVRPTYQSMYPPGQGFALAIGQLLTGVPWIGVVLTTALMCSAIYWMLLGWLSAPWAWLGGVFAVVRFGIFSYWINTYWGGSVAAIGGALVLGALPRLRGSFTTRILLVFTAGLLILANSRPLEGLLFSLPFIVAAAILTLKTGSWRTTTARFLPATGLLMAGMAFALYFNWRGTGNPLLMPYVLNFKTYHISKPFLFQQPNPIPEYTHSVMRAFYVYHEYVDVARLRSWELDALKYMFRVKGAVFYTFYLWPFLLLVVPALYSICRNKEFRIVLIATSLLVAGLAFQMWPSTPHYGAPGTGAVILLVLYSLRHFRNTHSEYGLWAARAAAIVLGVWMLSPIAERLRDPLFVRPLAYGVSAQPHSDYGVPLEINRERIKSDLESRPGKHLIIVHHQYHDIPAMDWIYNAADIDNSKVIWARDMGYLKNKELLDYYGNRQVWYVDRGDPLALIRPYSEAIMPWGLALKKFEVRSEPASQDVLRAPQLKENTAGTARLIPVSNSRTSSSETQRVLQNR